MSLKHIIVIAGLALAAQVHAQSTSGTMVIVPANGEVVAPNDQAVATFFIEEQDKDKAAAASRVNQKMKQGTEIIRREDPKASFKTHGYYTYPVYPEDRPQPMNVPAKPRQPASWRVGQYLEVKTSNLDKLPATAAAAQKVLALNGLQFGLLPATMKKLDEQRIAATYRNLNERIAAIAAAMGRNVNDAVLDTVDFEGSGNYGGGRPEMVQMSAMRGKAMMADQAQVAEPSFEPGETTLDMRLVGKVKFK